jgi:hypothetical protein
MATEAGRAQQPRSDGKDPSKSQPTMDEMMKEYMRYAAAGENHKLLAKLAGKWTLATKVWGMPGQPPMESKGQAESRLVLGGRFLVEETDGKLAGMPSKTMSLLGYDNFKKVYNYVLISDLATATYPSSGSLDASGKVLTLTGEMDDVVGKRRVRHVVRIESEDQRVLESYDTLPDGKEFKVLETTYTRIR